MIINQFKNPIPSIVIFTFFITVFGSFANADSLLHGKTLKSASELDYPPFALVKDDGTADGFSVDLLKAVISVAQLDIHFSVAPWHKIKQDLADGKFDVLPLVSYSEERDKVYDFTTPYLRMHGDIFVRKGDKSILSEMDLKDKEVLVMRGDTAHEYAVNKNLTQRLILTDNFEEAMTLLSSGRHDAIIIQQLVGFQLIKKLRISNIVSLSSFKDYSLKPADKSLSGFEQKFCFAVPEGKKELLAHLNEGLSIVIANGTYDALYNKWFGPILPEQPISFINLVKILFLILLPILFLLGIFGIWYLKMEVSRKTKSLQEEIKERKQIEKKLQEISQLNKEIINSAQDGIIVYDRNLRYQVWNPFMEIISETPADKIIGRHPLEVFPFLKETGLIEHLKNVLVGKTIKTIEFPYSLPETGKTGWTSDKSSPLRNSDGEITGVIAIVRDITEQKMAADKLLSSQKLYNDLVETAHDLIWRCDDQGRYVYLNKSCERIFGYQIDEMLGKPFTDFMDINKAENDMQMFISLLEEKRFVSEYETVHLKKDGSQVFLLFNAKTYTNDQGFVQGTQGTAQDITIRKRTEIALAESREQYRLLFENMINGFANHQIITDHNGKPVDYIFLEANLAFEKYTGLKRDDIIGKKVTAILPGIENDPADWIGCYGKVALSGQDIRFEQFAEPLQKWYSVQAFSPINGQFATVIEDITEFKKTERAKKIEIVRLEITNKINSMVEADEMEISDVVLEKMLDLSGSRIGFLGFLSDDEKNMNLHAWSSSAMKECKIKEKPLEFSINQAGLWAEPIRKRKPMFFNDYASIKSSNIYMPEGHVHISRIMVVPVFDGDKIVAVASVGNKRRHYDEIDVKQLNNLLDRWWELIQLARMNKEKEKMKSYLQQAQRMESIGTLAGGIAHDFNNMLGVISGNVSFLLNRHKDDGDLTEVLSDIDEGVQNSQQLTQQLLTFAKGGAPIKKIADLNIIIKESARFVTRGAKAKCNFDLAPNLWATEVDSGQINQVISNLVINANQAMPNGGSITIRSENTNIGKNSTIPLPAGYYIQIIIEDQGIGISEKHLSNIFDPYFSTKQAGSGLGLATTYSIIKRHGGYITAYSELDKGTTFTIYLPVTTKESESIQPKKIASHSGQGKILVMDDEAAILKVSKRILTAMGYEVVFAKNGIEAIEIYNNSFTENDPFDLTILDLTVPGSMGGAETIPELLEIDPQAKVVVSSGYSNDPVMANYKDYGLVGIIPKPYRRDQMAELLNKILGEKD